MTNEMNSIHNLIVHTFDDITIKLLTICSIPTLFTRELIYFSLAYNNKNTIKNVDEIAETFLSQPFVMKRKMKSKLGIIEVFSINNTFKTCILSSSSNIDSYAHMLNEYYNSVSYKGVDKLKKIYLYDSACCKIIAGNIDDWRREFQLAIENSLVDECNKLVLMCIDSFRISSSNDFSKKMWLEYYKLVCNFFQKTPCDSLESQIKTLISSLEPRKDTNFELIVFLFNLLGLVYLDNRSWEKAHRSFNEALEICCEFNITNYNVTGSIYINIVTLGIRSKELRLIEPYISLLKTNSTLYDDELKINTYKILALYNSETYNLNQALDNYYFAKELVLKKQKNTKNTNRHIEIKPVYCIDKHSIYDSIGEIFTNQGNYKKARDLYRSSLRSHILSNNINGIAWAKYNIGRIEYLLGNLQTSFIFFNQSISAFNQIGQEYNCAYIFGEQSYLYQYLGDTKRSILSLERSITLFLKNEMLPEAILYFNHLGRLYQSQGFLNISERIFNICKRYLEMPGNSENIGWLYNNLARNYMYQKKYELANQFFYKARKAFEKTQNLRGLIYVINNTGELYVKLNRISEAQALLKISLKYKRFMGDQHAICYTLRELGELYLKKGNINSAKKQFEEALKICEKYGFKMLLGEIYISFAKLYGFLKDEINETVYYTKAAEIYESQNFLSRLINCYELQYNCLFFQNNQNLYLIKKLQKQLATINFNMQEKTLQKKLSYVFKIIENETR